VGTNGTNGSKNRNAPDLNRKGPDGAPQRLFASLDSDCFVALTYTSTEHLGATLLCTIFRCVCNVQPATATSQIIGTCSSAYKNP
jgi:hypothetical protein